jgi:hypothetical protein
VDKRVTATGHANLLFRGGNPDISPNQTMNFDGLVQQIVLASKASKVALPKSFFLVDINLLNMDPTNGPIVAGFDMHNLLGEFTYFQKNPSKGMIVFWEMEGTTDNATIMLEVGTNIRPFFVQTLGSWQGDNLIGRMEEMNTLLTTDFGIPAILYGHCDCGCDRTGELFGSYYMRWMNMTWEETNELNTDIATRPMSCNNYLAMQWYCLWLRDTQNYSHLNCDDNADCSAYDPCPSP